MPFSVVTAATSVQLVDAAGVVTSVTLPTGVEVRSGHRLRGAILDRAVVLVNAVTQPIWLDADGIARLLRIPNPITPPTLADGTVGTLSGTFRVKMANLVKDAAGNVLQHSALSSASAEHTIASKHLSLTAIPLALGDAVNARRFFRTADGGTEYFEWFDLDDNTTTTYEDDASDESLSLVPAPDDLGSPPSRLTLIVEWKGRLWGVSAHDVDTLLGSAARKFYAWPLSFPVRPQGGDQYGITGFLPRRDELGIGKRGIIWKMTGDDETSFQLRRVVEGKGILAPDSCLVIRDVGYFLGDDGVYTWDGNGVVSITDDTVHPWFNTDTYFNRSEFPEAFGGYDPVKHAYLLFLCAAGGTTVNRWVSYDIAAKRWMGPHQTAGLTPTCAGVSKDSNAINQLLIGSADGYLHKFTAGNFTDGTASAIDFDVIGKFHAGDPPAPMVEHYFGQLLIATKVESGGTLSIIPKVGTLAASAGATISHDLTLGVKRHRRLGTGRLCQIRLRENTAGQGVEVYGYEIPWHELGLRGMR